MYLEPPWMEVISWPGVTAQDFDQCCTGLRTRHGLLVKKRTTLLASHEALVYYFIGLDCDGSHQHQQLAGGNFTAEAQVWSWDFAARVISGIPVYAKCWLKLRPNKAALIHPLPLVVMGRALVKRLRLMHLLLGTSVPGVVADSVPTTRATHENQACASSP